VTVQKDKELDIKLVGVDVDGDPLTYTVGNPAHGTLSGSGSDVRYVPAVGYVGEDAFTYTVQDNRGLSSTPGGLVVVDVTTDVDFCPASVKPSVSKILPADGRVVSVKLLNASGLKILWIRQDEPTGSSKDGWYDATKKVIRLRAERKSKARGGNGRVYFISYEATANAKRCKGTAKVTVPISSTVKAVAGTVRYDSTKRGTTALPQ